MNYASPETIRKRREDYEFHMGMFNEIDKEEDGEVYYREVVDYLRSTNKELEPSIQLEKKLHDYSEIGHKVLDYEQFKEVIQEVKELGWTKFQKEKNSVEIAEPDMRSVFKIVDADKSGNISRTELKMACKYLGKRYGISDASTWTNLMKEADVDNDGKLSYGEFKQIIQMAVLKQRGDEDEEENENKEDY